ncbi:MBL fold metallo-hydrolase [Svornostia abyssi]|uniref:MBL fold metallo-hydrolase n=1 Tax=Svornostia abyssi TaxID=2898438 RepID=A0ABY5PMN1_9ACTN|nr:MBL fold metallo-hydrolase [Parviterribacteraceae bacterium J379]
MPRPAHHVASLARFAAHRERREREDASVMSELTGVPLGLPAGLDVAWLGVAGYRLTYEGQSIYLDPYVSRVSLRDSLRGRPALPDPALIERHIRPPGDVLGVLVGHTHFDHAIDVPAIARRFDCPAYGSDSLQRLMALHGEAERAVHVEPHRAYELGPFTVTFVPSVHSKLLLGYKVPYDGELTCEHLDGLKTGAYRCGQVYGIHIEVAGATLYHQGSANLLDDEIRHRGVDVFLAGIAGRSFTPDYWRRIIGALEPRTIVASHFDDFFRPVDAPLGFSLNVNLASFPEEIEAVTRDVTVAAMTPST